MIYVVHVHDRHADDTIKLYSDPDEARRRCLELLDWHSPGSDFTDLAEFGDLPDDCLCAFYVEDGPNGRVLEREIS